MPVGQVLAGPAAQVFGARPLLLVGGAAAVAVGLALLSVGPVCDLSAARSCPQEVGDRLAGSAGRAYGKRRIRRGRSHVPERNR